MMRPDAKEVVDRLVAYIEGKIQELETGFSWTDQNISEINDIFQGRLQVFKNEIYPQHGIDGIGYGLDLSVLRDGKKMPEAIDITLARYHVTQQNKFNVFYNGAFELNLRSGILVLDLARGNVPNIHLPRVPSAIKPNVLPTVESEVASVDLSFDIAAIDREFSSWTHPDEVRETDPGKVDPSFRNSTAMAGNIVSIIERNITKPVDAHTDLSLIPENDLEENLQEWALIIKSCENLPVNFMFSSKDKNYEAKAAARLMEMVPEMKDRINVPQEGSLKLAIKHVKDLDKVGKDEYPVAMAGENISDGNVAIRDFNAAVKIGLLQAVLVMNKTEKDFRDLADQVKVNLEKIYKACGVEVEIGDAEIEQFTSDDPAERIKFAIKFALPPICRFPLEVLQTIHENNRMILEMA